MFYYIDVIVLLEITPVVKFIRNYIRDRSGVFSISSEERLSMTLFSALRDSVCVQSCQTNVNNFMFSWQKQNVNVKFMSSRHRVISSIYYIYTEIYPLKKREINLVHKLV